MLNFPLEGGEPAVTVVVNAIANNYAYGTRGDAQGISTEDILKSLTSPSAPRYGRRFTFEADDPNDGYGNQIWEKEILDGATSFTDGEVVGTYAWEGREQYSVDDVMVSQHEPPLGLLRNAHSPSRQYAPQAYNTGSLQNLGALREVKSSDDSITVLESIIPGTQLIEADNPALLPLQMHKYLRYYAMHRAFAVPGEGMRPDLAKHYLERFDRGILVLKFLTTPTARARVYRRDEVSTVPSGGRPPRVQLPSTFPRVL